MKTVSELLRAVASGSSDACLLAGLLLEQARGRDNRALMEEATEAAPALARHRLDEAEIDGLLGELMALLQPRPDRPGPPPTEALWALKVSARPRSWPALRAFVDRTVREPGLHGLQAQALEALVVEDGPLLTAAAALLASEGGDPEVRAAARAVLER